MRGLLVAWSGGLKPGAAHVGKVIAERPVMSWINLAEVYYRVLAGPGPG